MRQAGAKRPQFQPLRFCATVALLRRRRQCSFAASAAPIFPSRRWFSAATCSAGRPTRRPRSRCSTGSPRAGLNAVDTADAYSSWVPGNKGGESETIIGEWMKARGNRSRIVVITKVGSPMGHGKEGLKARYIEEAVEASLKRLQTDAIDLYLAHWPDMATPIDETLGAFQRLIEKGKIRWCGASNLNVELLEAAISAAKALGGAALRSPAARIQSRRPKGVRIRPRRPLRPRGDRRHHLFQPRQGLPVGQVPQRSGPRQEPARRRGQGLSQSARVSHSRRARQGRREHKAKPAEVALAWVTARPGVTAPIASATSVEQVDSLVRATELKLTQADMGALDKASAP